MSNVIDFLEYKRNKTKAPTLDDLVEYEFFLSEHEELIAYGYLKPTGED